MKSLTTDIKKIHFLKLESGEDVIESLTNYCVENDVSSGFIFGLGALKCANLGFFNVLTKEYNKNELSFNTEIVSATGNVTKDKNGQTIVHLHMAVGDDSGKTYGGHVLKGTIISVTGEFIIYETINGPSRELDPNFKLQLWSIS